MDHKVAPIRIGADLGWAQTVVERAIAEISGKISAPGPEGAVPLLRESAGSCGSDLHPIVVRADLHRRQLPRIWILRPIAKLTKIIDAPRPERSILLERECVETCRQARCPVAIRSNLDRS